MKRPLLILATLTVALLGSATLLATKTPNASRLVAVDNSELARLMADGVPVVDIRRREEWLQTGVIEGSRLATFFDARGRYDLEAWLAEAEGIVGPDRPVVLVCRSGNRTGQLGRILADRLGYPVYHLERGIIHWRQAGEPTIDPLAGRRETPTDG